MGAVGITYRPLIFKGFKMTYKEIKDSLTDLGFELDSEVDSDYSRVRLNAINRTLSLLWSTVILPNISYFSDDLDEDDGLIYFNENSNDEDETNCPELLKPLVQLLAGHWLWLDDDLTKATLYWNEYDDLKNQIIQMIKTPRKAKIVGGF